LFNILSWILVGVARRRRDGDHSTYPPAATQTEHRRPLAPAHGDRHALPWASDSSARTRQRYGASPARTHRVPPRSAEVLLPRARLL